MNTTTRISYAERLGRWAGRIWRGYARREGRVAAWLVARGLPAGGARALLWGVKLVLLGVLLYAAFWLALLVVFAVAVAWVAGRADDVGEANSYQFEAEGKRDHRESIFYHPLSHNDDPDPRFEDD